MDRLAKKAFCGTAFRFNYSLHLSCHCFDNLMQHHNIYFHQEMH